MHYSQYWRMAIAPKDLFCDCYGHEYGNLNKKDISLAFKLMMKYIILDLINRGVGFKFPNISDAHFEFLVVDEDKVKSLKNRGWLDKLSVFDSDFLSYKLYYCRGKVKIPINFHSYLQDALLDKINTGVNLCSVKYRTLKDYIPIFYKMYPNISKTDVRRLIKIGFERLYQVLSAGAAFSITSNKIKMHIGTISWNSYNRSKQFKRSFMVRERYKYIWNGEFYSGYYYIPIPKTYLKKFAELNVKSKYWVHFGKIHAYKVLNEVRWFNHFTYVFRVPMEEQKKFTLNIRDTSFKNPELIGIFEKGVFREDHTHWKKIIKQISSDNETGK